MIAAKGGASEPPNIGLPGKAGGAVAVRRTLACTICRIADPTQVPRPRQLRDASTVMRFQPAHQSMINRRFNDRASCPARQSLKQTLERKPRIHSPASGKGGHESVQTHSKAARKPTGRVARREAPSRCFCCFRGRLSAIDISFSAEILGRRRFGELENSGGTRCSLAVPRCFG